MYAIFLVSNCFCVLKLGLPLAEHRKKLLFGFGCAGAISATLFLALPSSSPIWPLSALLAAVANVGFGVSIVAMNAYLPELGREAPEVKLKYKAVGLRRGSEDTSDGVEEPLLEHEEEQDLGQWKADYDAELSRTTSRISSLGIALGYGAGIVLLILALVPVTLMKGTTFALRLAIGFSGIWWAVFMIPAFIWIPSGTPKDGQQDLSTVKTEIIGAWKRLGGMLHPREIKRLRNTFKYLGAWFLLSDGSSLTLKPLEYVLTRPYRFHHNHVYRCVIWKDHIAYDSFLSYCRWHSVAVCWNSWIFTLAQIAEAIWLVKFARASDACSACICNPSLWLFRIHSIFPEKQCEVWWIDNQGRAICACRCLWFVVFHSAI